MHTIITACITSSGLGVRLTPGTLTQEETGARRRRQQFASLQSSAQSLSLCCRMQAWAPATLARREHRKSMRRACREHAEEAPSRLLPLRSIGAAGSSLLNTGPRRATATQSPPHSPASHTPSHDSHLWRASPAPGSFSAAAGTRQHCAPPPHGQRRRRRCPPAGKARGEGAGVMRHGHGGGFLRHGQEKCIRGMSAHAVTSLPTSADGSDTLCCRWCRQAVKDTGIAATCRPAILEASCMPGVVASCQPGAAPSSPCCAPVSPAVAASSGEDAGGQLLSRGWKSSR